MKRNQRRPVLAAIAGAALLMACGVSGAQERQPSESCPAVGGTLKVARTADVADWYYNLDNPSIWAWPLVNLPLVQDNADASELVGAAAETWEVNDDSTVFTFHLRPGLKFSNGADVTSADVLDSIQRNTDDPKSTLKSRMPPAVVTAPDASTVVTPCRSASMVLVSAWP